MEVKFNHAEALTITINGRLDTVTSAQLDEAIKQENVSEATVILDFAAVEYISSAGLRLLLALKRRFDDEGKAMEVHNINAVVREVFRVTGFINTLTVK